jgi:hypothetical protein
MARLAHRSPGLGDYTMSDQFVDDLFAKLQAERT